jgi:hypothetical protein
LRSDPASRWSACECRNKHGSALRRVHVELLVFYGRGRQRMCEPYCCQSTCASLEMSRYDANGRAVDVMLRFRWFEVAPAVMATASFLPWTLNGETTFFTNLLWQILRKRTTLSSRVMQSTVTSRCTFIEHSGSTEQKGIPFRRAVRSVVNPRPNVSDATLSVMDGSCIAI